MRRAAAALCAVLLAVIGTGAFAQTVYPSPRLAAVAFAIQNGFNIPRTNVVVVNEVTYGGTNDVRRLPTDRRTTLPLEETLRDAQALAKLLGPDVKTGWAKELLAATVDTQRQPTGWTATKFLSGPSGGDPAR